MLTIEQVYSITELGASLDSRRTFFFVGQSWFFFVSACAPCVLAPQPHAFVHFVL
jgi:hypothetical protein